MTPLQQLQATYGKQQRITGTNSFREYHKFLENLIESISSFDPKVRQRIREKNDEVNSNLDLLEAVDHS